MLFIFIKKSPGIVPSGDSKWRFCLVVYHYFFLVHLVRELRYGLLAASALVDVAQTSRGSEEFKDVSQEESF